MSFMSTAPRPQTQPSATLAGERVDGPVRGRGGHDVEVAVHAAAPGRLGSSPSSRTTTLARPGADSNSSGSSPTSVSCPATYSAAARSPGPVSSP